MSKQSNVGRYIAAGLLLLVALLILPFLASFSLSGFKTLLNNDNMFGDTLYRTIGYSLISGVILTFIGFWGAIFLNKVAAFSTIGKNLSFLILPVTLGNISIAFICKLLIGDSAFFSAIVEKSVFYKLGFLLVLQIWQLGLLFIYLFWLQFQSISTSRLEYSIANKFSFFHTIKDIYLPHTRNLWILLAALGMVFSLYEESKIQYLFKASQGTNSELITNWLGRNYQSSLLVDSGYASQLTFRSGWAIFTMAIISFAAMYVFINAAFKFSAKAKFYPVSGNKQTSSNFLTISSKFWGLGLILAVIIPVVICLCKIQYHILSEIISMGTPLLMTFIAAITASLVAIIFGMAARLGWKHLLGTFNNRSLIFFVSIFMLMLIPPVIILISGYKWMSLLGYSSVTVVYVVWILGHTLLSLPILGSFVLFNHFRVSTSELNYLSVYGLSRKELLQNSFIKRFKAEYLLLFIISFSFIWNEAILNNLFSDYIPSFVSKLKMMLTGRASDYSKAFSYLIVSVGLAMSAVAVWRYVIEKAEIWILK